MAQHKASIRLLVPSGDMETAARFYDQLLGEQSASSKRRISYLAEQVTVDVVAGAALTELLGQSDAPVLMAEIDDVDGAVTRLQEAGGTLLRAAADTPLGRTAVLRDPDGRNVLVVRPHSAVLGE